MSAQIFDHPAYQKIIKMGNKAVPLILHELKKEPDHWFVALTQITGENPIQENNQGVVDKMTKDWLNWGSQKGYKE